MINRLLKASSGTIYVAGKDISSVSPEDLRRNIGYVLQHNGLFPHYTVGENIAIVPNLLKWPKNKITNRIAELLEQLHLPHEFVSVYPQQLSGGQQQRVGLARALATDPPVLLMDEPFGALDAVTRTSIKKEFAQLDALKKKTVVLVTHDIGEAFDLGDHILLMDKGKIVQAGTPTDLLFSPANKFVKDFFEAQRMQLELNAVLLRDLWPHLSFNDSHSGHVKELNEQKSMWEALDVILKQGNRGIAIKNASTGETKFAGYNSLFTALSVLKHNR
jgi:osmoprotectant transport system ATP-binding protein